MIHKKRTCGDILKKSVLLFGLCLFAFSIVGYTSERVAYQRGPVSIVSITVMTRNLYVGSAFNILLDISTPERPGSRSQGLCKDFVITVSKARRGDRR